MEMVTTISECPLNSFADVMFASGSYDGNVSVWSLSEKSPIFSFECSNVNRGLIRGKYGVFTGTRGPNFCSSTETR